MFSFDPGKRMLHFYFEQYIMPPNNAIADDKMKLGKLEGKEHLLHKKLKTLKI